MGKIGTIFVSMYFAGTIYLCCDSIIKKKKNIPFFILNGFIGVTSSFMLLGVFTGFVTVS